MLHFIHSLLERIRLTWSVGFGAAKVSSLTLLERSPTPPPSSLPSRRYNYPQYDLATRLENGAESTEGIGVVRSGLQVAPHVG